MQRLMTDTLQLQYNILHIDNEDDAQKMFEANTIDIIIYDPANNNYDFIDQLQTNKASKNIPLIFVSTESEKTLMLISFREEQMLSSKSLSVQTISKLSPTAL